MTSRAQGFSELPLGNASDSRPRLTELASNLDTREPLPARPAHLARSLTWSLVTCPRSPAGRWLGAQQTVEELGAGQETSRPASGLQPSQDLRRLPSTVQGPEADVQWPAFKPVPMREAGAAGGALACWAIALSFSGTAPPGLSWCGRSYGSLPSTGKCGPWAAGLWVRQRDAWAMSDLLSSRVHK